MGLVKAFKVGSASCEVGPAPASHHRLRESWAPAMKNLMLIINMTKPYATQSGSIKKDGGETILRIVHKCVEVSFWSLAVVAEMALRCSTFL
jgi:hypothetical protein